MLLEVILMRIHTVVMVAVAVIVSVDATAHHEVAMGLHVATVVVVVIVLVDATAHLLEVFNTLM